MQTVARKSNMWDRLSLHRLGGWLKKDDNGPVPDEPDKSGPCDDEKLNTRSSRKRSLTFKRQESERQDRRLPDEPAHAERRARSADRWLSDEPAHAERRARSADRRSITTTTDKRSLSPTPKFPMRSSAPDSMSTYPTDRHGSPPPPQGQGPPSDKDDGGGNNASGQHQAPWGFPPSLSQVDAVSHRAASSDGVDEHMIQQELDAKWILNLSMHFRDMSDREKFFVTYAEEPNRWRRVTVSIDYRNASPDSLEADLKSLHFQRDKNARIYEAIRESLPDVQFYETVTNLKLETSDGRLHVHVTEDVNEIIPYPPVSSIAHLSCPIFHESHVRFESHLSGFVYKITVDGRVYIKKEIPGPEAVEEFLYETNTLSRLRDSQSVIQFAGVITDDQEHRVTGLLISFADKGALVDLLYDCKGTGDMLWPRRERWAKQIVQGLSEIHESGFVQGDFTLSNIVIDSNDDAKIIDINRRGCPVGWEPPELARLIEYGQRIGIFIGVKSDLFQLGMVLWALAEEQDEPERQERPLAWTAASDGVPRYFRDIVEACLSEDPRGRLSAKDLLTRFPDIDPLASRPPTTSGHSLSTHRSDKEYIDPRTAVERDDIDQYRRNHVSTERGNSIANLSAFADVVPPTEYEAESSGSYIMARRGRSPFVRNADSPASDLDDSELENEIISLSPQREPQWEQIYIDGNTRLVNRGSLTLDDRYFSTQGQATVCISTPTTEGADPLLSEQTAPAPALQSSDLAGISAIRDILPYSSARNPWDNTPFDDCVQFRHPHDDVLAGLTQDSRTLGGEEYRLNSPTHQDSGFHDYDIDADLHGFAATGSEQNFCEDARLDPALHMQETSSSGLEETKVEIPCPKRHSTSTIKGRDDSSTPMTAMGPELSTTASPTDNITQHPEHLPESHSHEAELDFTAEKHSTARHPPRTFSPPMTVAEPSAPGKGTDSLPEHCNRNAMLPESSELSAENIELEAEKPQYGFSSQINTAGPSASKMASDPLSEQSNPHVTLTEHLEHGCEHTLNGHTSGPKTPSIANSAVWFPWMNGTAEGDS